MRILDEYGVEISAFDPTKGRVEEKKILLKHHEAVEAVEEVGHYEVVKEYPNGGKDTEWVVDVPGVEAREAWDEFETVLQFIPFTKQELATQRIAELKQMLRDTDFHILKIVEGVATLRECAEIIAKRIAWRQEINELERERSESDG